MSENILNLDEMSDLLFDIIKSDGKVSIIASGVSMEPFIRNKKDVVTLIKVERKIEKGDVPLYRRSNGKIVLHRVIGKDENGYIIRGDNQWTNEYGIKDGNIIALLYSVKKGGIEVKKDSALCRVYEFFLPLIRFIKKSRNFILIRAKWLRRAKDDKHS